MTIRPPLLRRLLHDVPEGQEHDVLGGPPAKGALTDREAWLCVRSRLVAPRPRGSWLVWALGPTAVGLAMALAILWLRAPAIQPPGNSLPHPVTEVEPNVPVAAPASKSPSELVSGESPVQLALPEGSFALVEPHGTMALLDLRAEHIALRLDLGAVYVHASPQRLGELRVYAGDHVVIVHGTGFRVERSPDQLRVQLRHGSVEVRSLGSDTEAGRFLVPGEELLIEEHQPLRLAHLARLSRGELDLLAAEEGDTLAARTAVSPTEGRAHHAIAHAAKDETGTSGRAHDTAVEPTIPRVPSLQSDIARCRALFEVPERQDDEPETTLRLDLTVSETGQVIGAAAEHGAAVDPRLSGCLAEAALDWHLDAPPESLRGLQFVFPIKL
jgi:hypothetical protein